MDRAKHYLLTAGDTDKTDDSIYAPSIHLMMQDQAELDRGRMDELSKKTIPVSVEVDENMIFSGRDVLLKARRKNQLLSEAHLKRLLKAQDREDLKCGRIPTKIWKTVNIKKRTCCGPSCGVSWRGSKGWRVCKREHLYICPKCRINIERARYFVEHCKKCK